MTTPIRSEEDIVDILTPVDPRNASKRLRIGYDYTSPRRADRKWKLYDEDGQWCGNCTLEQRLAMESAKAFVHVHQRCDIIFGVGIIDGWSWKVQPAPQSLAELALAKFREVMRSPALFGGAPT